MKCYEIDNFEVKEGIRISPGRQFVYVRKGNIRQYIKVGEKEDCFVPLWRWECNEDKIYFADIKFQAGLRPLLLKPEYNKNKDYRALVLIRNHSTTWAKIYYSGEKYPYFITPYQDSANIFGCPISCFSHNDETLVILSPNSSIQSSLIFHKNDTYLRLRLSWDGSILNFYEWVFWRKCD